MISPVPIKPGLDYYEDDGHSVAASYLNPQGNGTHPAWRWWWFDFDNWNARARRKAY